MELLVAIAVGSLALMALAALGAQIALPRIAAARIRDRVTEGGGSVTVSIVAWPAHRLLRNAGDQLRAQGRNLVIDLGVTPGAPGGRAGLSALDGFTDVDVEILNLRTGPLVIDAFVLSRAGGGSYAMAAKGTTTGAELIRFGDPWLRSAIPGGGLFGAVAGGAPLTSRPIGFSIEIELISDPDGLRTGAGAGTIAGYPAGPLAATIAAAVARRLEVVP